MYLCAENRNGMEYSLSKRVKELCRERGIQLKDLASRMGIAPESLSRAINGNPQLSTVRGIAEGLDVPVSELFTADGQMPLTAIIVCEGKTYTAHTVSGLKAIADMLGGGNCETHTDTAAE